MCVCVGPLTLLQAWSKPLALLLGAATTMANYFLFFCCFGESVDRIFLSTEKQREREGIRKRVEITLAIDAAVAAAA